MFFSCDLLCKHKGGKFSIVWYAAIHRRISSVEALKVNVMETCEAIIQVIQQEITLPGTRPRFSLYLSSVLMFGIAFIHKQQMMIFIDELSHAEELLFKSFIHKLTETLGHVRTKTKTIMTMGSNEGNIAKKRPRKSSHIFVQVDDDALALLNAPQVTAQEQMEQLQWVAQDMTDFTITIREELSMKPEEPQMSFADFGQNAIPNDVIFATQNLLELNDEVSNRQSSEPVSDKQLLCPSMSEDALLRGALEPSAQNTASTDQLTIDPSIKYHSGEKDSVREHQSKCLLDKPEIGSAMVETPIQPTADILGHINKRGLRLTLNNMDAEDVKIDSTPVPKKRKLRVKRTADPLEFDYDTLLGWRKSHSKLKVKSGFIEEPVEEESHLKSSGFPLHCKELRDMFMKCLKTNKEESNPYTRPTNPFSVSKEDSTEEVRHGEDSRFSFSPQDSPYFKRIITERTWSGEKYGEELVPFKEQQKGAKKKKRNGVDQSPLDFTLLSEIPRLPTAKEKVTPVNTVISEVESLVIEKPRFEPQLEVDIPEIKVPKRIPKWITTKEDLLRTLMDLWKIGNGVTTFTMICPCKKTPKIKTALIFSLILELSLNQELYVVQDNIIPFGALYIHQGSPMNK